MKHFAGFLRKTFFFIYGFLISHFKSDHSALLSYIEVLCGHQSLVFINEHAKNFLFVATCDLHDI